jgi:hypothetical protein
MSMRKSDFPPFNQLAFNLCDIQQMIIKIKNNKKLQTIKKSILWNPFHYPSYGDKDHSHVLHDNEDSYSLMACHEKHYCISFCPALLILFFLWI